MAKPIGWSFREGQLDDDILTHNTAQPSIDRLQTSKPVFLKDFIPEISESSAHTALLVCAFLNRGNVCPVGDAHSSSGLEIQF